MLGFMEMLPSRLVRLAQKLDLPVGALTAIRALKVSLDDLETRAVASAREKGASWEDIALALGVSRQAVQQKHGHPGAATRRGHRAAPASSQSDDSVDSPETASSPQPGNE